MWKHIMLNVSCKNKWYETYYDDDDDDDTDDGDDNDDENLPWRGRGRARQLQTRGN